MCFDPVLDAHEILSNFFVISSPVSPLSIRDQIVRATLLADRLLDRYPAHNQHPVLVVGAGAAGLTAAIRLKENRRKVVVAEMRDHPFYQQKRCSTRWINPTQYDWPRDYWREGRFCWIDERSTPLPWESGYASQIADRWTSSIPGDLNVRYSTSVSEVQPSPVDLVATLRTGGDESQLRCSAVIWATGFGAERSWVASDTAKDNIFEGSAFWEDDTLEQRRCGLELEGPAEVAISGCGDGAVQDFIRCVTKSRSVSDFYSTLCKAGTSTVDALEKVSARLLEIERLSEAHYIWSQPNRYDATIYAFLQDAHLAVLSEYWPDLERSVALALGEECDRAFMLFTGSSLTPRYALNRFFALLIAKYLRENLGFESLYAERFTVKVNALPEDSVQPLEVPPGRPLLVATTVRDGTDDDFSEHFAHLAVIRHGILGTSPKLSEILRCAPEAIRHSRPRHILPSRLLG